MLVIRHFDIYLTAADVMHEAGYVYSIQSTSSTTPHLDNYIVSIFPYFGSRPS